MSKIKSQGPFRKANGSFRGKHCVEVSLGEKVLVRDSKNPSDGTLVFTRAEWRVFVAGVKANEFNVK